MKKPSFQFYPGDWRKDQDLSRATKAAKGILMDILCLAFECEKRGKLMTDKKAWSIEEISYAVGGDMEENKKLIDELLSKKILKKDQKGCVFSSRMVKDEKLRKVRTEAGYKGGNPNLVNQTAKQKTTPSSSSSSSTSVKNINVVVKGNEFFEMFRRASGSHISDDELITEAAKFKNKYPNVHSNKAGALINAWVANIGKVKPLEKQMIV